MTLEGWTLLTMYLVMGLVAIAAISRSVWQVRKESKEEIAKKTAMKEEVEAYLASSSKEEK